MGIVFEVVFTILGLGFGIACGVTLTYGHVLGPIVTHWIEYSSEKKLVITGTVLISIGATLQFLQHFF